jgi:hypothetical protein
MNQQITACGRTRPVAIARARIHARVHAHAPHNRDGPAR